MRRQQSPIAVLVVLAVVVGVGSMLTGCTEGLLGARSAPVARSTPRTSASVAHPSGSKQAVDPEFPVTNPSGSVDAAAQHKADTWLAGAVVPPGAVRASTRPDGVESRASAFMWCTPMADAVGYWTIPGMTSEATFAWLVAHASQGMRVASGGETAQLGDGTHLGAGVVDEPSGNSLEALIFTVTPIGTGSAIRADALTMGTDSKCVTPPPNTSLSVGG